MQLYYDNVVQVEDDKGDTKFYRDFGRELTSDSPKIKETLSKVMKTFTMPAGRYVIADACVMTDEYYEEVLDEWANYPRGEAGIIGSGVFLYCTGSDGAADVKTLDNTFVGSFYIDAANISIIPDALRDTDRRPGVPIEFDNEFTVKVDDDAIIINDEYRIEI